MARYEMTDFESLVIDRYFPKTPEVYPCLDDKRVLNGIFWVLRSCAPCADLPSRYGPHTTSYNRFRRWIKSGIWDRIMDSITDAYDGGVRMIDGTSVRVHHSAVTLKKATRFEILDEA